MRRAVTLALLPVVLLLTNSSPAKASRVVGEVTRIIGREILADFPVPVYPRSMMMVLRGDGDSIAGTAIAQRCEGDLPPYQVTGELLFAADAVELVAGKKVYVNSINTAPAPSSIKRSVVAGGSHLPMAANSLGLYYFAAGQTVGYGALGLGYERGVRIVNGLRIELDGGITGVGNISARDPDVVNTDQLIKSASGRVRLDFGPHFGFYSAYRWTEARGDAMRWDTLTRRLRGEEFIAPSTLDSGKVRMQGIEYGLAVSPAPRLAVCAGYVPAYRADYGSLGVRCEPAYTAEIRLGVGDRILRLRGVMTDGYWMGDLAIAIR